MKFPNNRTIAIAAIAAIAIVGFAATAQAFTFQTKWPTSPMGTDIAHDADPTLAKGVKYIYEWGVGLGGVAVFIVLVMAGFQYITSVGDPTKMKDAFKRIEEAVIGLLILLSSYAILNLVGINLKALKVTPFDVSNTSPIKTCTGEGSPEPECCLNEDGATPIPNCIPDYWACSNGYCKINTKAENCTHVYISYEGGSGAGQDITAFNSQQKIAPDAIASKMERFYDDKDGNEHLCYDATNPDAKDAAVNHSCNCSVQIYTKSLATAANNASTQECASNDGVITTVNNADFASHNDSTRIICVSVIAPEP